jgi:hypothetical protein
MTAPSAVLQPRIWLYEAYILCRERYGTHSLAKQRLIEHLASGVPSWSMEPFGPIELWVWQEMRNPFAGELAVESNEILLYGPGRWLGIEVDHAALRTKLGLTESPPLPPSCPRQEPVAPETTRPGRKAGQSPAQRAMCQMAMSILSNDRWRPKQRHGRKMAIARMIKTRKDFKMYKTETIADYIRDEVADWETKNPGK